MSHGENFSRYGPSYVPGQYFWTSRNNQAQHPPETPGYFPWNSTAPSVTQTPTEQGQARNPGHGTCLVFPGSTHREDYLGSASQPSTSGESQSKTNSGRVKWSDDETAMLIAIWKNRFQETKRSRNKTVWEKITKEFNNSCSEFPGFQTRLPAQVKAKIKNLLDAYKEAKMKNNKSGHNRETSPFYEEIDEIMGERQNVNPTNIVEASEISSVDNSNVESREESISEDIDELENATLVERTPARQQQTGPQRGEKRKETPKNKNVNPPPKRSKNKPEREKNSQAGGELKKSDGRISGGVTEARRGHPQPNAVSGTGDAEEGA